MRSLRLITALIFIIQTSCYSPSTIAAGSKTDAGKEKSTSNTRESKTNSPSGKKTNKEVIEKNSNNENSELKESPKSNGPSLKLNNGKSVSVNGYGHVPYSSSPKVGTVVSHNGRSYFYTGLKGRDSTGRERLYFEEVMTKGEAGEKWSQSFSQGKEKNKNSRFSEWGYSKANNNKNNGQGSSILDHRNDGKSENGNRNGSLSKNSDGTGTENSEDKAKTRIWHNDFSGYDHDPYFQKRSNEKEQIDTEIITTAIDQVEADLRENENEISKSETETPSLTNINQYINELSKVQFGENNNISPIEVINQTINSHQGDHNGMPASVGWSVPDEAPYRSGKANKLNIIRDKLRESRPKTPQQYVAKEIGEYTLRAADNEFLIDSYSEDGEIFLEVGLLMAEIATDIFAASSIAKSAFMLMTNRGLDGHELSDFERAFELLNLATLGSAGLTKGIEKISRAIEKLWTILSKFGILDKVKKYFYIARYGLKNPRSAHVYAKLYPAFKNLPIRLHPKRIKVGTGNGYALVGRGMDNIGQTASELRNFGYDVSTFTSEEGHISDFALNEWKNEIKKSGGQVPSSVVPDTKLFKEDTKWIDKGLGDGRTFLDIGNPDNITTPSDFYEMEIKKIFGGFR